MAKTPTWTVDLFTYGPLTLKENVRLTEAKGFASPFFSEIKIADAAFGASLTVTVCISTGQLAQKASLFFCGEMLDVLSAQINQPLYISLRTYL